MKSYKYLFIVFILLFVTGCSVFLTSEKALIDKNLTRNFCSNQNFTQLTNKVEKRMNQCYGGDASQTHYVNGAVFSTNISNQVTKKVSGNGAVSFVLSSKPALNPRYYQFRVQLENTNVASCKVRVTTHVISTFWNRASVNLEKWIGGEQLNCPQ